MFVKSIIAAAAMIGAVAVACAADISGAGATFPFPIYAKWADSYKKETGNGLNYQSIGSGAGIKQIRAKTVTFGATDAPLEAKDLDKDGLAQWPMVMGGIVMVVNIPGVKPGELVLDGPTVAQIYMGKIVKMERSGDREAQSEPQAARSRDRQHSSRRRVGHHLQLHLLSLGRSRRSGNRASARRRPSNGRRASGPRATTASPTMSPPPPARSAMSSSPTPSRTS